MDSVNERKIYQLIYDSVADDRCSQYFLLTPKVDCFLLVSSVIPIAVLKF